VYEGRVTSTASGVFDPLAVRQLYVTRFEDEPNVRAWYAFAKCYAVFVMNTLFLKINVTPYSEIRRMMLVEVTVSRDSKDKKVMRVLLG